MKFIKYLIPLALVLLLGVYLLTQPHQKEESQVFSSLDSPTDLTGCKAKNFKFTDESDIQLMEAFNACVLSIQSKEEVNSVIDNIIAASVGKSVKNFPTVNLYKALLQPIKRLEAIMWRLRPIGELSGAVHSSVLSAIRSLYYKHHLVGPHFRSLVQYVVEPPEDKTRFKMFVEVSNVQDFLTNETKGSNKEAPLVKDLKESLDIISQIQKEAPNDWNFKFDQRLFSGEGYISEKQMNKIVVKDNMFFIRSGIERLMGAMYFVSAYQLDELMSFVNDIVKTTAINQNVGKGINSLRSRYDTFWKGLFGSDYRTLRSKYQSQTITTKYPEVVTPRQIRNILDGIDNLKSGKKGKAKKNPYVDFLKPRANAQKHLDASLKYFKDSVDNEFEAWTSTLVSLKKIGDDADSYFVNPKKLNISSDKTRIKLSDRKKMFEAAEKGEEYSENSYVDGKKVRVNLKALFTVKNDLKDYFPQNFEREDIDRGHILKGEEEGLEWAYIYGRPTAKGYKHPDFSGLFPDVTHENFYSEMSRLALNPATAPIMAFIPVPGIAFIKAAVE